MDEHLKSANLDIVDKLGLSIITQILIDDTIGGEIVAN